MNSAKIICAPAGWGKTHHLLCELKDHLNSLKDQAIFRPRQMVIVPYREQARRFKDLLIGKLGQPALFAQSVMSYSDLVKRIFPEFGGVSQIQRRLILQEILETLPLGYYGSARSLPGFTGALSEFISEWKGLFLTSLDFEKALKTFPPGSSSALKLQDLYAIFQTYQERIQVLGMMDYDDSFRAALLNGEKLHQGLQGIERISFDGFYDFLPSQLRLLEKLREAVPEVKIYITHEEGKREALFDLTRHTISHLEKAGFTLDPAASSIFTRNHRSTSKDLPLIERELFSARPPSGVEPSHVQIFEGVGLRGEVLWIARELLRLKRAGKQYWSDMAVLLREVGEYGSYIREIFSEHGIPHEIHERRKLRENPWVRHLLDFFRLVENGASSPDLLFDFLRSSYLDISREAVIDFEQFTHGKGLWQGPDEIADYLTDWLPGFKKAEEGRALIHFITMVLTKAASLQKDFSLGQVREFLGSSIGTVGNFFGENFNASGSRIDYEAHRTLLEILTEIEINQEGRGKPLDLTQFFKALREGVELSLFSVHEIRQDAVQIYSVQLARQKEYKAVFLCGLLQKNFPETLRESAVLKDEERIRLSGLGFEPRLARASHERYYFYMAVTRASERLYLTYPRFDLEGKESLPSFFVEELTRLFKKPPEVLKESQGLSIPPIEKAVSIRDMKNYLSFELGEKGSLSDLKKKRPQVLSLYNFLCSKRELRGLNHLTPAGGKDVRIANAGFKKYLRNLDNFSPTALETYGGCSIRYFFSKILRLIEPGDFDSPRTEGTLLHELLKELIPHPLSGDALRQAVTAKIEGLKHFRLEAHEKRLAADLFSQIISRVLEQEAKRLQDSPFQPRLFEETASFGKEGAPQERLPLEWEGESFHLIGEMDRVDVDETNQEAIILDYKRGKSRSLDPKEIEEGTHLQLPLYGLALKKLFGLDPVSYAIYSIKGLNLTEFSKAKVGPEVFHRLELVALEHAGRYVKRIRSGNFKAKPVKCPDSCPFPAICRFEKWRKVYLSSETESLDASSAS